MDLSKVPKEILRILQSPELSMPQKLVAFNMLIPNLPADPKHTEAYNDNLEVGNTIKRWRNGVDKCAPCHHHCACSQMYIQPLKSHRLWHT